MKVYVETNWLLDLTLEQERISTSSLVKELAKEEKICLCMPELSIVEAGQKITRRRIKRDELERKLRQERQELIRSRDERYRSQAKAIEQDIRRLREISEFEMKRFNVTVRDISKILTWLHLDDDSLQKGFDFENQYDLDKFDALIYAVIRFDAALDKSSEKCFVDYDSDFEDPALKQDMANFSITLLNSPESVEGFLRSKVC